MSFVGRTKELEALKAAYTTRSAQFIPIYGRRRVGKSELILQSLKNRQSLYLVGKRASRELHLTELLDECARRLDEPLLRNLPKNDWKGALLEVTRRWSGRLILVFDEFQWLVETSPELPAVLQELWDREWKPSKKMVLILCGSYVGFMEREVLGKKSPLFGRRTGQIFLKPFGYQEAAKFIPSWSLAEAAKAYFILGGIPLYLNALDPDRSMEHNIRNLLLEEHAPLFREADFLLREELREVETYFGVLVGMAGGASTPVEIARDASVVVSSLPYYLNQLLELGYIARRYPLDGKKPNRRSVRYVIEDPLLKFWFRFVYPHLSFVLQEDTKHVFHTLIKPDIDAYFGVRFEAMCREALPALYRNEGVSAAYEVGEYWDKTVQIDVVGRRQDGWLDLGECKWGSYGGQAKLRRELETKLKRYPNPKGDAIGRRFFVRRRPAASPPGEHWYGLNDLYEV